MCVCVCALTRCVFILSVRNSGGCVEKWEGVYFNGLLKEINGLQMAQSIYSNEAHVLAMSIEQRAMGEGGGASNTSGHD